MAGNIGVGQFVTDVCKCPIEPGQAADQAPACCLGVEPVAAVESIYTHAATHTHTLSGSLRDSFELQNIETVVISYKKCKRNTHTHKKRETVYRVQGIN